MKQGSGGPAEKSHATALLVKWAELNAFLMGLSTVAVLSGIGLHWVVIAVILSFSVIIAGFRGKWTPKGSFGIANGITLFRVCGASVLLLAGNLPGLVLALSALFLFALDGIDGLLARGLGLSSAFGETFDKEADALLLLALCLLLYSSQRLGVWILVPGLLRYLFVGYLKLCGPGEVMEQRSSRGRWIYFLMMLAVLSGFVVDERFYFPIISTMSVLLCLSFAESIYRLNRLN